MKKRENLEVLKICTEGNRGGSDSVAIQADRDGGAEL